MFSSLLDDLQRRNTEARQRITEETGTVRKIAAYLGKSPDDPTIEVPTAQSEYPSKQLAYFYTLDTDDVDTLKVRSTGSALNPLGFAQHGLPVWVAEHLKSRMLIVIGQNMNDAGFYTSSPNVTPVGFAHGEQHYLFGAGEGIVADPAFISTRQIVDGMLYPTDPPSLNLMVFADGVGVILVNNSGQPDNLATGLLLPFVAHVPAAAGKARWVAVYFNQWGNLGLNAGSTFTASASVNLDVSADKLAQIPFPGMPLGWVYLKNGQTTIDYQHIRRWGLIGASGRHFYNPNYSYLDEYEDASDYNIVLASPIEVAEDESTEIEGVMSII